MTILDLEQLKHQLRDKLAAQGVNMQRCDIGRRKSYQLFLEVVVLTQEHGLQTLQVDVPESLRVTGYAVDAPKLLAAGMVLELEKQL